jgi:hypothetical protein
MGAMLRLVIDTSTPTQKSDRFVHSISPAPSTESKLASAQPLVGSGHI